ncbi:hypothetical protein [Agromyces sp. NPDC058126]|uniref:hypothetical protein n=1 Tax=Agromyces sp. NPDC058126 TaxID=3346350 RepID=UPI0036DB3066
MTAEITDPGEPLTITELTQRVLSLEARLDRIQDEACPPAKADLDTTTSDERRLFDIAAEQRTHDEAMLRSSTNLTKLRGKLHQHETQLAQVTSWESRRVRLVIERNQLRFFARAERKRLDSLIQLHDDKRPRVAVLDIDGTQRTIREEEAQLTVDTAAADASKEARSRLAHTARKRITEMLLAAQTPPTWFSAGLGVQPAGDSARWFDAAIVVLLYRWKHTVTDPVLPLGDRVEFDHPAYQDRRAAESALRSATGTR